ncbi:MAG: nicotinate (nicotinamide) nucleotide adenylyltransferase [Spirochaetales bacterium]|nr:nicotinate (nicotinamide) nucleotide adenylyltransferase [Spirochaetales bacterium]MCF7937990.1 nicotinate (nicotinamide) nucleotide adenylyltransferase [Spirochaetales bacterium]
MKAAILGGTFNPPHIGHLYLAEEVHKLGYDSVFLVPAHWPAHKPQPTGPTPSQRIEMLEQAAGQVPYFRVESCEIDRGGTSYTIETVHYLLEHYRIEGRPALVVGDDLAEGFSGWKRVDELAQQVDFLVARRSRKEGSATFPYPHTRIENIFLPISSRDIRRRVAESRAFRYLVCEPVYQYIVKEGLYALETNQEEKNGFE